MHRSWKHLLPPMAVLLVGCAGMAVEDDASDESGFSELRILESRPQPAEEDDLLYQLLVAELAAARGRIAESLDAYLAAMERSDDPEVASRAARVALYADREEDGLAAARRWMELDPENPEARQAMAVLAVRAGRPNDARRHLRDLVRTAGDNAGAMVDGLSAGLAREDDRETVLVVMRNLSRDFPDLIEAHRALAQAALRAGEPGLAAEAAARALEQNPDDRQMRTLYGQGLLESGDEDAAIQVFQQLMDDYPDDGDLRLHLARLLLQAERDEEALEEFQRLLDERPDDAGVLYAAGLLNLEAGRPEQARPHLRRLVDLGERLDPARFLLGRIGEQTDDPEEAERWYRQVEGEQYVDARLRLAIVLHGQDNESEAMDVLQALRRSHPDDAVRSYLLEGELLRAEQRYRESVRVYDRGLMESPGDLDLLYARALTAVYLRDVERVEKDLRRVLEAEPDNPAALNALGYTLVDMTDRIDEGVALIRRAYEQDPDNVAIIDSMGWALYRQGRNEEALEYLNRAFEMMPDGEIGAHLGEVLWVEGRRNEARAVWRRAAEEDPEHPVLMETRERLDP